MHRRHKRREAALSLLLVCMAYLGVIALKVKKH